MEAKNQSSEFFLGGRYRRMVSQDNDWPEVQDTKQYDWPEETGFALTDADLYQDAKTSCWSNGQTQLSPCGGQR